MPSELTRPDSIVLLNRSTQSFEKVARVASAIQQQVLQHLRPLWGAFATIIARKSGESLPDNSWVVYLTDKLDDPRLAGVHYYTPGGKPYAMVATDEKNWSIAASHEVLEMLTDPKTDTFRRANDPNGEVGLVDYLLEVCDPCQHDSCAYFIEDVMVSDFYGPDYFNTHIGEGRLSMNDKIRRPLQILPGGYVSFRDARGDMYIATADGTEKADYRRITGFQKLPGDTVREQVDFYTASMKDVGYFVRLRKKKAKKSKPNAGDIPMGFGSKKSESEEDVHIRHFEELSERVKIFDQEQAKQGKRGK